MRLLHVVFSFGGVIAATSYLAAYSFRMELDGIAPMAWAAVTAGTGVAGAVAGLGCGYIVECTAEIIGLIREGRSERGASG